MTPLLFQEQVYLSALRQDVPSVRKGRRRISHLFAFLQLLHPLPLYFWRQIQMSKSDLIQGSNPVHGNEPQEVGGDNEGGEAQEVDDVQQGPHIHSTQISIMKSIF